VNTTEIVGRHFTARGAHNRWLAVGGDKDGPHHYVEKSKRGLRRYAVVKVLVSPIPIWEPDHE